MPTAKERIEELKRQVKNAPGDASVQELAAAEIIAIRNICQVERKTGYGLEKRIPAATKGQRINGMVNTLLGDNVCRNMLRKGNTVGGRGASGSDCLKNRFFHRRIVERRSFFRYFHVFDAAGIILFVRKMMGLQYLLNQSALWYDIIVER